MNSVQNTETSSKSVSALGRSGQYLTFILAGEEYGVDILRVQEIKGWDRVTSIPHTPNYIRGVINLRGTIVPIVDLRLRFEIGEAAYDKTTVVVVLKVLAVGRERTMGFVVDAVSDVYDVSAEAMKPTPDFGASIDTRFVRGLAAVDEKMVILLDVDALIGHDIDAVPETLQ